MPKFIVRVVVVVVFVVILDCELVFGWCCGVRGRPDEERENDGIQRACCLPGGDN